MSTPSPVPLSRAVAPETFHEPVSGISLAKKNVLITGAASGIGAVIARTFAEKGAYVTLVDKNEELGKEYTSQLQGKGLRVQFVAADVTSWEAQVAAFKAAVKFHPDSVLDIVVANAGMFSEPFVAPDESPISLDQDPPRPETTPWEVNTIGFSFTAKLAQLYFELPSGKPAAKPKCLILVSCIAAYVDFPVVAAYTSSKYGARGFFKNMRGIFSSRGHRVNLIAPWIYDTPMAAGVIPLLEAVDAPVSDIDLMSNAAVKLVEDDTINGRAFSVGPERMIDLCDDVEGGNAETGIAELRKDAPQWEEKVVGMLELMGYSKVF
ncbi:Aflh adha short chain alcohol dehydrogenase protein [Neofusicoccum parvum]|uniref:Aflh adha short chain alcohol dehydrogenase protein n=1 Tax=Neofusicoccum parvum TaxID=310453 RepID=A0ACB5SPI1_9PEZI|nr:Aflh adha short chain alcohol dehydrogenase protein [Neofusicoccum parvum]